MKSNFRYDSCMDCGCLYRAHAGREVGYWSVSGFDDRSVDVSEASSVDENEPRDDCRGETVETELGERSRVVRERAFGVLGHRLGSRLTVWLLGLGVLALRMRALCFFSSSSFVMKMRGPLCTGSEFAADFLDDLLETCGC